MQNLSWVFARRSYSSYFEKASRCLGNDTIVITTYHNEQQKMLVQVSWHTGPLSIRSDKQNLTKSTKHLNHQHFLYFTTIPCFRGFPPKSSSEATALFALRIHGRLRLEEPLDHGIVAVLGCQMQRCFASGAAARGQAAGRTQQNEGEKNSETILVPQKSKFGNCCHSNSPWI